MRVWGASAPSQTLPAGLGGFGPGPNPAVARAAAASGMCCGSSPAEAVLCTRSLTGGSLAAVLSLREGRPALHAVPSALQAKIMHLRRAAETSQQGHSPYRRPWRSTGVASSTSSPTARCCCRRKRGPRQASTRGRARGVWWQGVCCHSGQRGETLKFSPSAQTLYTTSSVISDYTTEPGALGYIVEVDLQSLPPSGFHTPPKTE